MALVIYLAACRGETPRPPGQTDAPAQGIPFAVGTVGHAVDGYFIDMTRVRSWYAVSSDIGRIAEHDSTFHFSLNIELSSPLTPYVSAVEQNAPIQKAAQRHGLTAKEFVVLTAAVSLMRITRQLADSLGPSGRPANVGANLWTFARANRVALDSLEASLAAR